MTTERMNVLIGGLDCLLAAGLARELVAPRPLPPVPAPERANRVVTATVARSAALLPTTDYGVIVAKNLFSPRTRALGFWRAFAYSMWGWALACSGDVDQGRPHLERGAVLQEGVGIKAIRSIFWTRWAEGLLLGGDLLEAKRAGIRGLELAEERNTRLGLVHDPIS